MGSLTPPRHQPIKPVFPLPTTAPPHADPNHPLVASLGLSPHIEGGFYLETDRDPWIVPTPWPEPTTGFSTAASKLVGPQRPGFKPGYRNASTSILYLLTTASPLGAFHRNRARTIHTLHRGRGRYVVLHPPETTSADGEDDHATSNPRTGTGSGSSRWMVETFVVGLDVDKGERVQWVVEGGRYKASFLLADDHGDDGSGPQPQSAGLLISETVVPGFEYCDHDFLPPGKLETLVDAEAARELAWLVRRM